MNFFSIDAYSSIWFWLLLIIAWLIAIDKFSVHSHFKWLAASNGGASQQTETLKSFYFKADYLTKYRKNNLILLPICFFSISEIIFSFASAISRPSKKLEFIILPGPV